jgi:hypothetical protein
MLAETQDKYEMFVNHFERRQSNLKLVKFHCLCMLIGTTNVCINKDVKDTFYMQEYNAVHMDPKQSHVCLAHSVGTWSYRSGCTAAAVRIHSQTHVQRHHHVSVQESLPTGNPYYRYNVSITATPDIPPQTAANKHWRYIGLWLYVTGVRCYDESTDSDIHSVASLLVTGEDVLWD